MYSVCYIVILQTELTQIEEKIVQERVDWKLKIDALSEQLVSQRLHQSSVREEKQSNMEVCEVISSSLLNCYVDDNSLFLFVFFCVLTVFNG